MATDSEFLYRKVERRVMALIDNGVLCPGDRAPSLRRMSQQAQVSLATVMQAYLELERKGLVEARPKSGFFVRPRARLSSLPPRSAAPRPTPRKVRIEDVVGTVFEATRSPDMVSFGIANPSTQLLPVKSLARITARTVNQAGAEAVEYCFVPGAMRLRRQIARRYAEQGCEVAPEDILITNGATGAIATALQSVASKGDVIAVESPCYFLLLQLIQCLGMLAVEVRSDPEQGMNVDALRAVLDEVNVRAVIAVANFSNPTGSCMPDERKRQLVGLLTEREVPLIEDDLYGDLHFEDTRPTPLKRFDEEGIVLSCSSFSKTVAPGYRIGWLVAGRYHEEAGQWQRATASSCATLPQLVVAEFLASGNYERFLRRVRASYRDQVERMRYAVLEHFPRGTRVSSPQGGFVLWVELPRGTDADAVFIRAIERGVSFTPGSLFSPTRKYRNFLRLSCGAPWSDLIEQGLLRLAGLVREQA